MTEAKKFSPTLCVDFDGVIHSYESGWQGEGVCNDPPVPGAIEWLREMLEAGMQVSIYSSRSETTEGVTAMTRWLGQHWREVFGNMDRLLEIDFPTKKPAAFLTIDDRCMQFNGVFPSADAIWKFKPWNKTEPPRMFALPQVHEAGPDGTFRVSGF